MRSSASAIRRPRSAESRGFAVAASGSANSRRSNPDENARPSPVTITTDASVESNHAAASAISRSARRSERVELRRLVEREPPDAALRRRIDRDPQRAELADPRSAAHEGDPSGNGSVMPSTMPTWNAVEHQRHEAVVADGGGQLDHALGPEPTGGVGVGGIADRVVAEEFAGDGVRRRPRRRRSPALHRSRAGRAQPRRRRRGWRGRDGRRTRTSPGGTPRWCRSPPPSRCWAATWRSGPCPPRRRHRHAEVRCMHPHAERSDQPELGDLRPAQQRFVQLGLLVGQVVGVDVGEAAHGTTVSHASEPSRVDLDRLAAPEHALDVQVGAAPLDRADERRLDVRPVDEPAARPCRRWSAVRRGSRASRRAAGRSPQ